MTGRRTPQAPPPPPENGDLSTYGRFKDRLTLMLLALVLGLVGFIAQDQMRGRSTDQMAANARLVDVEADLRQFKDRVNSQFDERLRMLGSHAERLRAVETEVRSTRTEIVGRLERIETKLDEERAR
jgi:uncharacterized membrane-anchored protein YhcB (DUF1043 family)